MPEPWTSPPRSRRLVPTEMEEFLTPGKVMEQARASLRQPSRPFTPRPTLLTAALVPGTCPSNSLASHRFGSPLGKPPVPLVLPRMLPRRLDPIPVRLPLSREGCTQEVQKEVCDPSQGALPSASEPSIVPQPPPTTTRSSRPSSALRARRPKSSRKGSRRAEVVVAVEEEVAIHSSSSSIYEMSLGELLERLEHVWSCAQTEDGLVERARVAQCLLVASQESTVEVKPREWGRLMVLLQRVHDYDDEHGLFVCLTGVIENVVMRNGAHSGIQWNQRTMQALLTAISDFQTLLVDSRDKPELQADVLSAFLHLTSTLRHAISTEQGYQQFLCAPFFPQSLGSQDFWTELFPFPDAVLNLARVLGRISEGWADWEFCEMMVGVGGCSERASEAVQGVVKCAVKVLYQFRFKEEQTMVGQNIAVRLLHFLSNLTSDDTSQPALIHKQTLGLQFVGIEILLDQLKFLSTQEAHPSKQDSQEQPRPLTRLAQVKIIRTLANLSVDPACATEICKDQRNRHLLFLLESCHHHHQHPPYRTNSITEEEVSTEELLLNVVYAIHNLSFFGDLPVNWIVSERLTLATTLWTNLDHPNHELVATILGVYANLTRFPDVVQTVLDQGNLVPFLSLLITDHIDEEVVKNACGCLLHLLPCCSAEQAVLLGQQCAPKFVEWLREGTWSFPAVLLRLCILMLKLNCFPPECGRTLQQALISMERSQDFENDMLELVQSLKQVTHQV